MKTLQTELSLTAEAFLSQQNAILTMGSCFAEHMGERLLAAKWRGLNAPFGTLFHPLALSKILQLAVKQYELDRDLFVEQDAAFFHYDLPSRFYASSPQALQNQWQMLSTKVRQVLAENPCVLLTLGTAWVYEMKQGPVVANCHKQAADQFKKRLLTLKEIEESLETWIELLPRSSQIIVSLSPVRHIRDTMVANSLSKSILLVQLHRLCERHAKRARYFPAFEIMMDELRDYRFYAADMIHPSLESIEIIWQKFVDCYCEDSTKKFIQSWQTLQKFLQHKPQRPEAPSYQRSLRKVLDELDSFSDLDCEAERLELQARLIPEAESRHPDD